jgi:prepilin signal peptidase PulO-like enzyme (type II secretory pathway)
LLIPEGTSIQVDILCGVIGLFVGGFLNQLAVRTLKERSPFNPPPQCPKCQHRLGWLEVMPIFSYFSLKGKCQYCRGAIAWYYPFVEIFTAISFVTIVRVFGLSWYGLGMLIFVCALIAVSITDFMEKLIPHEITYPAMLLGIIFSVTIRHDFWSTLAGIGISYILVDFTAFYGLKVYLWLHQPDAQALSRPICLEPQEKPPSGKTISRPLFRSLSLEAPLLFLKDRRRKGQEAKEAHALSQFEDIELIGGGDAVLYAVVSAWLGLNRLIFTLLISFFIGAMMGAAYLLHDMYKERALQRIVWPVLIGATSLTGLMACVLAAISHLTGQPFFQTPWYVLLPAAALCGSLFGIIWVGGRFSKPFPFGPAIAAAAAVALLTDPFARSGNSGP